MKIYPLYNSIILPEYVMGAWTLYNAEKMSFHAHSCGLHRLQINSTLTE